MVSITCSVCEKVYTNKDSFSRHKQTHLKTILHICSKCKHIYKRKDYLLRHKCTAKEPTKVAPKSGGSDKAVNMTPATVPSVLAELYLSPEEAEVNPSKFADLMIFGESPINIIDDLEIINVTGQKSKNFLVESEHATSRGSKPKAEVSCWGNT